MVYQISEFMVLSNPKFQKAFFALFVIVGLGSFVGLAWEGFYYAGTFQGYNDFSTNVIWANTTIISSDTGDIRIGLNISNPGIYPVEVYTINVYVSLNGESYIYALVAMGTPDPLLPGSSRLVNGSRQFVHQPTVTAFQQAFNSDQWNWVFSIDIVFHISFLEYSTRRFTHNLEGTINL